MSFVASHVTLHAHCTSPFLQRNGLGILLHHVGSTFLLGPIRTLRQNFGYTSTQRLFLMSKLSVNTTLMELSFRSLQHLETKPVWVVISRSSNRHVDELRHRESQNFSEDVAPECVQRQEKEQSQGERSEDHIPNHQRVWECQPMNTVADTLGKPKSRTSSVKLVRLEHSRERETDRAIHWKFTSPKLIIRFQRDGGSNFTDRDWINFIWNGSNQTRFQYCQNSCGKLLCLRAIQGHTGRDMNDSTRDPGQRPHAAQLEVVCIPSRMFVQFNIHIECWTHRRRARRSRIQTRGGGEDGCHAPILGCEWKVGCPKSPTWKSEARLGQKTKVCLQVALVKAL